MSFMASSRALKVISYGSQQPDSSTILIIHGAFSSHAAFIPIARLLEAKGYHILIPDLPAHGSGSSGLIKPFDVSTSVSLLAELIQNQAHAGKAHVVGFSLGAYLALRLAADHPGLVDKLFCSGAGRQWDWSPMKQNIASYVMYSMSNAPKFVEKWFNSKYQLVEPPELIEDALAWKDGRDLALHRAAIAGLAELGSSDMLDRVKAPVLLISASAHDPVEGQRLWRERLVKGGCPEVQAVELPGWPHAWDARDPDLFAESVAAWIEQKPLPEMFVKIV